MNPFRFGSKFLTLPQILTFENFAKSVKVSLRRDGSNRWPTTESNRKWSFVEKRLCFNKLLQIIIRMFRSLWETFAMNSFQENKKCFLNFVWAHSATLKKYFLMVDTCPLNYHSQVYFCNSIYLIFSPKTVFPLYIRLIAQPILKVYSGILYVQHKFLLNCGLWGREAH